jgi:hypothetical protein
MQEGAGLVVLVIVGGIAVVACLAVGGALFPRAVAWTRRLAEEQAGRSFLIGLANLVFLGAVAAGVAALGGNLGLGFLELVAVVLAILLILGVSFGLLGMTELVGDRLFPDSRPLGRTLGGGAALTLACLAPYVGWYGLLPYVALRGLGAFILGWFAERAKPSEVVAVEID